MDLEGLLPMSEKFQKVLQISSRTDPSLTFTPLDGLGLRLSELQFWL